MSACLPTSSKRRRNPSSSIPENPISTDFNSAAEYLAYVQNQADECPKIVTAEPDPGKNRPPKPSTKVSTSTLSFTSFSPSPQAKPPSEEWILSTYRTFQEGETIVSKEFVGVSIFFRYSRGGSRSLRYLGLRYFATSVSLMLATPTLAA